MRTTLEIADDVLQEARSLARYEGISIGEAVSRLARRGLHPPPGIRMEEGFPVFDIPPDDDPITLERTLELEDEL